MEQILDRILALNLIASTISFYLAARFYLMPRLRTIPPDQLFQPILLFHSFRHLGLMFITLGAVYPGVPEAFAVPAAIGDLIAAVLALVALYAIRKNLSAKTASVWLFNIWGTLDLLYAIGTATFYNAANYMGPSYWIPAFWVPALLVTHYIVFKKLLQPAAA